MINGKYSNGNNRSHHKLKSPIMNILKFTMLYGALGTGFLNDSNSVNCHNLKHAIKISNQLNVQ